MVMIKMLENLKYDFNYPSPNPKEKLANREERELAYRK